MTHITDMRHKIGDTSTGLLSAGSPNGPSDAFFEDDGETAFLYGRSLAADDNPVVHVCHIYNVATVGSGDEYPMELRWADAGNRVGFFIDDVCCAVIDFDQDRTISRTLVDDWDDDDALLEGL